MNLAEVAERLEKDKPPRPDIAICSECGWRGPVDQCWQDEDGDWDHNFIYDKPGDYNWAGNVHISIQVDTIIDEVLANIEAFVQQKPLPGFNVYDPPPERAAADVPSENMKEA